MKKPKVLFICIHNSARSQMAEALLTRHCGDCFEAHSAGLEPGTLNPMAVEVLREIGMDISGKTPKSVFRTMREGHLFAYVIAVCDAANAEKCPIFPGPAKRIHWSFPDPSGFEGPPEKRLQKTREVRDMIAAQIKDWCAQVCPEKAAA